MPDKPHAFRRQGATRRLPPVALVLALGLAAAGCRDETPVTAPADPPQTISFAFQPADQGQVLVLGDTLRCTVTAEPAAGVDYAWRLGGRPVDAVESYSYVPTAIGADTLRVAAGGEGGEASYYWVLTTVDDALPLPPPVPLVSVREGTRPGEAVLTWQQVTSPEVPVAAYAFAASSTGPLTGENWAAAEKGRAPRTPDTPYYAAILGPDDDLVEGALSWFYVRTVTADGRMSPVGENARVRVPGAWWLTGRLVDTAGNPVPGQDVAIDAAGVRTVSGPDGRFRLGPLLDIDNRAAVRVVGSAFPDTGWCGFTSTVLDSLSGADVEITLLPRRSLGADCELYGGEWLTFFRHMTNTRDLVQDPEASRLWSWAEYPVSVWVPPGTGETGLDFAAALREAMATWNLHLGDEYLRETASRDEADVVCEYTDELTSAFGRVRQLLPAGVNLGESIPELLLLQLDVGISSQTVLRTVALHEFGHALGLPNHCHCSDAGYLLTLTLATGNLASDQPIHPDELTAVRALRHLPQGVDMGSYRSGP